MKGQRSLASFGFLPARQREHAKENAAQPSPMVCHPHKRKQESVALDVGTSAPVGNGAHGDEGLASEGGPEDSGLHGAKRSKCCMDVTQQGSLSGPGLRRPSSAGEHNADLIPTRVPDRHRVAQRKLGDELGGSRSLAERADDLPRGAQHSSRRDETQKPTPLEQQVMELKRKHPHLLLMVEVGYKMRFFCDDALVAAQVCNIHAWKDRQFFTASVPTQRTHHHIRRLVEAGHRVGLVRQVETAAVKAAGSSKAGPFQRQLVDVYTPATLQAGCQFDAALPATNAAGAPPGVAEGERLSSYMLAVCWEQRGAQRGALALVAVEASTGDVLHQVVQPAAHVADVEACLMYAAPRELLLVEPLPSMVARVLAAYQASQVGVHIERIPAGRYRPEAALDQAFALLSHHGLLNETRAKSKQPNARAATEAAAAPPQSPAPPASAAAEALMALPSLVLQAVCAALEYLASLGLSAIMHHPPCFRPFHSLKEMQLSPNALRQLEVLGNADDGGPRGSLLQLLDHCVTAMGSRVLRRWLSRPLADRELILARQAAVAELLHPACDPGSPLLHLRQTLSGLPDLERGVTRALHTHTSPAEFLQLLRGLVSVSDGLGVPFQPAPAPSPGGAAANADVTACALKTAVPDSVKSPTLRTLLDQAMGSVDQQAASRNDVVAMLVCESSFPEVAEWRVHVAEAEKQLQNLLPVLARQAGVPRLEYVAVQHQGDFMVELPASRQKVPEGWEKICSTKKVHRWRPREVSHAVQALDLAKEKLQAAAGAAWKQLQASVSEHYAVLRAAVRSLGELDALQALAKAAEREGYTRPELLPDEAGPQGGGGVLEAEGGRHPMLEVQLRSGRAVVPNDFNLCADGLRAALITGPNMGGKSCYIRTAALLAIMAQVGSFVPAAQLRMRTFDGVYTRMGASDNLLLGKSTFLEELEDAAVILAGATRRSLVIVDELGRGTATHDGAALAYATLDHLVARTQCLTLFVTHYPELAQLQSSYPRSVASFHMGYVPLSAAASAALPPPPHAHSDAAVHAQAGGVASATGATILTQRGCDADVRMQAGAEGEAHLAGCTPPASPTAAEDKTPTQSAPPVHGSGPGALPSPAYQASLPPYPREADSASGSPDSASGSPHPRSGLLQAAPAPTAIPRIAFLYRLAPGAADCSFGLNAARAAGIPEGVLLRAASVSSVLSTAAAHPPDTDAVVAAALDAVAACAGCGDAVAPLLEAQRRLAAGPVDW